MLQKPLIHRGSIFPCSLPFVIIHPTVGGRFVGKNMARVIGRLTALKVSRAIKPGMYADGGGLYLQVTGTGAKSWIYRYMLRGREREMGLGSLSAVMPRGRENESHRMPQPASGGCRSHRRPKKSEGSSKARCSIDSDVQGRSEFLHRCASSRLAQSETHLAVGRDADHLCQPNHRRSLVASDRYYIGSQSAGADLADKA